MSNQSEPVGTKFGTSAPLKFTEKRLYQQHFLSSYEIWSGNSPHLLFLLAFSHVSSPEIERSKWREGSFLPHFFPTSRSHLISSHFPIASRRLEVDSFEGVIRLSHFPLISRCSDRREIVSLRDTVVSSIWIVVETAEIFRIWGSVSWCDFRSHFWRRLFIARFGAQLPSICVYSLCFFLLKFAWWLGTMRKMRQFRGIYDAICYDIASQTLHFFRPLDQTNYCSSSNHENFTIIRTIIAFPTSSFLSFILLPWLSSIPLLYRSFWPSREHSLCRVSYLQSTLSIYVLSCLL